MNRLIGLGAATLIAIASVAVGLAQDGARAAVLVAWDGTVSFGPSWPAAMEFSDDQGTLRWKASFRADERFYGDAEGTVTSFTPPKLELVGAYTSHSTVSARGTRIRFSLTV